MEKVMAHLEALAQGDKDCCEDLLYALILPDMVMGIKEGARPMMGRNTTFQDIWIFR